MLGICLPRPLAPQGLVLGAGARSDRRALNCPLSARLAAASW